MGDRLIQKRQRVAHRAFGRAGDQGERVGLGRDPLFSGDGLQMFGQQPGFDPPQIEALAAREHRDRHLADLGGGEDEFRVRGRLLERLQQRVERRRRKHVDFVEDVDLVTGTDRGVADRIVDLAHVVDAVVRGGVHLQHVDVPALHDGPAMHAERGNVDARAA